MEYLFFIAQALEYKTTSNFNNELKLGFWSYATGSLTWLGSYFLMLIIYYNNINFNLTLGVVAFFAWCAGFILTSGIIDYVSRLSIISNSISDLNALKIVLPPIVFMLVIGLSILIYYPVNTRFDSYINMLGINYILCGIGYLCMQFNGIHQGIKYHQQNQITNNTTDMSDIELQEINDMDLKQNNEQESNNNNKQKSDNNNKQESNNNNIEI